MLNLADECDRGTRALFFRQCGKGVEWWGGHRQARSDQQPGENGENSMCWLMQSQSSLCRWTGDSYTRQQRPCPSSQLAHHIAHDATVDPANLPVSQALHDNSHTPRKNKKLELLMQWVHSSRNKGRKTSWTKK